MNDGLSVNEVERQTGIPDATIRRYIRNHGHHLQIRKRGKSYLIANESLSVIKKIRELYDSGKQLEDVDEILRQMNVPVTITMADDEKGVTVNPVEVLIQLQKDMNELKKSNDLLHETLEEVRNEMRKSKENANSSTLEEKPRSLWRRIQEKIWPFS